MTNLVWFKLHLYCIIGCSLSLLIPLSSLLIHSTFSYLGKQIQEKERKNTGIASEPTMILLERELVYSFSTVEL